LVSICENPRRFAAQLTFLGLAERRNGDPENGISTTKSTHQPVVGFRLPPLSANRYQPSAVFSFSLFFLPCAWRQSALRRAKTYRRAVDRGLSTASLF